MQQNTSFNFFSKIIKFSVVLFVFGFIFFAHANFAQAADKYWCTGVGTQGGNGTWNAANSLWATSAACSSLTTFAAGDNAIFGGTVGTVTVSSPNKPAAITINTTGYTLSAGTITPNATSITITLANSVSATISSIIANASGGATAINVSMTSGSGTLTLSGQSTFTGVLTVGNGVTLKLGATGGSTNTPLGTITGATIVSSGGTLNINGYAETTAEPLTINGTGASGTAGALINSGATQTFAGPITIESNVTIGDSGTGNMTLSGAFTGTGNVVLNSTSTGVITLSNASINYSGTLTNSGSGSANNVISGKLLTNISGVTQNSSTSAITLSGASTFTSAVNVTSGTLKLGVSSSSATAGPTGTTAGGITVSDGCTLDLNGFSYTSLDTEPLTINGTGNGGIGVITNGSGTASTYIGAITLGSDSTVLANNGNITLSGAIALATYTLTLSGSNAASASSGIISNGTVIKTGTGQWTFSGVNSYSGGLYVKSGTVVGTTTVQAFGAGSGGNTIYLGDTGGTADATILGGYGGTFAQPINVVSGSTGNTLRIGVSANSVVFGGAITLAKDLTIGSYSTRTVTFSGGITGTGNVTVNTNYAGSTTAAVTFSTGALNYSGTFTNGNTLATGTTTVNSAVSGSVTQIIQASSTTSPLTIGGAVTTTSGTDKIFRTTTSSTGKLSLTGGITGDGTITFDNDSSTAPAGGITVSTASPSISNTNTVTNAGSGTSSTVISGIINTNVTGVFQNSSTSQLTLSGANTFTSGVTINAGTVSASATAALGATTSPLTFNANNTTLLSAGTVTMTSARTVTFNGDATIDTTGGNITIPKNISTSYNLTKAGINSLILSGSTASISGDLILGGGILSAPTSMTLGGSLLNTGGSLTPNSSTVTFTSTSSGEYVQGSATGATFYNVIFNGSGGEWTIDTNPLVISNDLTMTAGALLGSTQNVTVSGNVQCGVTCGTINLTGGTFRQDVATNKNFGTSASGDSTAWTFGLLEFSDSTVGTPVTITVPTVATGNITATIGVTVGDTSDTASTVLDAGNRLWTLSGQGGSLGDTYPTIEGRTNSANTSATTSHIINFDTTPNDGDLLIVVASFDNNPTVTWPDGWTQLSSTDDGTGKTRQEIRYRVASSDTSSITLATDTSQEMEARAWRLGAGEYVGVPEAGTPTTGNSLYPDPPSVSPTWGSDSNYFISVFSADTALTTNVFPTNYIIAQGSVNSGGTTANTLAYAGRQYANDSDDPDAFTKSATGPWVAQTIVIRGYPVNADVMTLNASSTLTGNASTFRYTGNGATIACAGANYYDLRLEPTASGSSNRQSLCHAYGATLSVANNLTIGDGTHAGATGASNDPAINVAGNLILASGTFVSTGETLTVGGTFTVNGTFSHNDGTVALTDGSSIVSSGTVIFYNLTTAGTVTANGASAIHAQNDFTINSGTFTSTSNILNVGRNFTNNGTFVHNNGTVAFDDAQDSEIAGNNTVFYNFNVLGIGAAKTVKFAAGATFTFAGPADSFVVTGTDGNLITITSTTTDQWLASFTNTQAAVTYVSLSHSGCSSSATVSMDGTSINDATPTANDSACWLFVPKVYWYGGSGNWNDGTSHWSNNSGNSPASPHATPSATDDVVFDSNSSVSNAAYTVTMDTGTNVCHNFTMNGPGGGNKVTWAGSTPLYIYGSLNLSGGTAGINRTNLSVLHFAGTSGNYTIASNGIQYGGTISIEGSGGTYQLQDDLATNGYFALLDGAFNPNGKTVTLFGNGAGQITATLPITFYNLSIIPASPAKTSSTQLTGDITVSNLLTVSAGATATNRVLIKSSLPGTQRTITAASVSIANADFQDIIGAGASSWNLSGATNGSGDCGRNSGITFTTPADQHWTNASSGNWSASGNWTSRVPLPQDNVYMDKAFGTSQTVTADMPRLGKNIDWTGATFTTALTFSQSIDNSVFGNFVPVPGMTITSSAKNLIFEGASDFTLNTHGVSFGTQVLLQNPGNTITLGSDWAITGATGLTQRGGTLTCASYALTIPAYAYTGTAPNKVLNLGSATHLITGSGTAWQTNQSSLTVNAETSTLKFTDTSNTDLSFYSTVSGRTYNNVWFARGTSVGNILIKNTNTFADFKDDGSEAHSLIFTNGKTYTFGTFTVSGHSEKLITLTSDTTATYNFIKSGEGAISSDYLDIQHSVASPDSTWYAGANSTDHQSIADAGSGWIFTAPPPSLTQFGYRWRLDNSNEVDASYVVDENEPLLDGVYIGDTRRLRLGISNTGVSTATDFAYRLEYSSNSCSSWTQVPAAGDGSGPWEMTASGYLTNSFDTTDSTGLTNPSGKSFVTGKVMTTGSETPALSLTSSQFTELEYSLSPTSNVSTGTTYCFRATNAGVADGFTYSEQPEIKAFTMVFHSRGGGSSAEAPSAPPDPQVGNGSGGGDAGGDTEPPAPPSGEGTGGTGGGSGGSSEGDSGFLYGKSNLAFVGASGIDVDKLFKYLFNFLF